MRVGSTRGRAGRRLPGALRVLLVCLALAFVTQAAPTWAADRVTALGRLEPGDGVIRVAGPSVGSGVIAELRVAEGDQVKKGQLLALLDRHGFERATVAQQQAELDVAEQLVARLRGLSEKSAGSRAKVEDAEAEKRVAKAALVAARARLALQEVRAPIEGQVLEIHARAGERIGDEGVLALGETSRMMAVAEVYETDVAGLASGGRARISSPALPASIGGEIERVGLWIGRQDVLDTDPVAKIDSRVVEVRIRLDPETPELASLVSRLTHLQVEVEIER